MAKLDYILKDEALKESQDNLYLSYMPADKTFKKDKSLNCVTECTGIGSHVEVLKEPYKWMQLNSDKVVHLNVHGNDKYDKVVRERCEKLI